MKWNKILGVIFSILGILMGILGAILIAKELSVWTIWYAILFWLISFLLIYSGVELYSINGKRNFRSTIDRFIQILEGILYFS